MQRGYGTRHFGKGTRYKVQGTRKAKEISNKIKGCSWLAQSKMVALIERPFNFIKLIRL